MVSTISRERLQIVRERIDVKRRKAGASRANLTEHKVAALVSKRKPYRIWDVGSQGVKGLHVLVSPAGTKLFRYSFRFAGAPSATAYALGRWPGMTLAEARDKAEAAARQVRKGIDPRVVDPSNTDTFEAVVHEWHEKEQVGRLECKTADANRDTLLREFASLKHRPLGEITYREVDHALSKMRKDGRVATALRCHTYVKAVFAWAELIRAIDRSPIASMPAPAKPLPRRTRAWFAGDRADGLVAALWAYADKRDDVQGKLLKLLVCTGKRLGILVSMRWEAIDRDWYWTPPPGIKNKKNNAIPLPKLVREIIGPRQQSGLVLGRELSRGDLAMLGRQVRQHVEPTYLHHGCRHLVATKLRELKVPYEVRRLLLDHSQITDVHSAYEHDDAREEMAAALETWCTHVKAVVAGKLPLKRERL